MNFSSIDGISPLDPKAYTSLAVATLKLAELDGILTACSVMLASMSRFGAGLQAFKANFVPVGTRANASHPPASWMEEQSTGSNQAIAMAIPDQFVDTPPQSLSPSWKSILAPAALQTGAVAQNRIARGGTSELTEFEQIWPPSTDEPRVPAAPAATVVASVPTANRLPNAPLPKTDQATLEPEAPTAALGFVSPHPGFPSAYPEFLSAYIDQQRTAAAPGEPPAEERQPWPPSFADEPPASPVATGVGTRAHIASLVLSSPSAPIPSESSSALSPDDAPIGRAEQGLTSRAAFAPSPQPQGPAEAREGTIILDGAELGRWMIDHLASHAMRPGAGTTGIDPRMNASYPGAPTGV